MSRIVKVGVIGCSSRNPRANPQIIKFVIDSLNSTYKTEARGIAPEFKVIDLKEWNLPFLDESDMAGQIKDTKDYDHEHTRKWSVEVKSHDAFVFVTPQYNWGYPAVVKNAIDFLFHEWNGKPGMIVSYGGHGGGKANSQLKQVLQGVKMIPNEKNLELHLGKDVAKAAYGKDLGLDGTQQGGLFGDKREELEAAFEELVGKLTNPQESIDKKE